MIFVLELDGSLCFDGHQIAEPIHQALDQLSLSHRLIFTTRHPLEEIGPWLKARWPASDVVSAQSAEQKYQDLSSECFSKNDIDNQIHACYNNAEI